MHGLQLRLAGPDDAAAIAAVLLEAFIEFRPLYTDEGFAATTPSTTEVLIRLKEGPHDLFGTPLFTMEKLIQGRQDDPYTS